MYWTREEEERAKEGAECQEQKQGSSLEENRMHPFSSAQASCKNMFTRCPLYKGKCFLVKTLTFSEMLT